MTNKKQVEGRWMELMGDVQANWGTRTHDDLVVIAGRLEQLRWKLNELYGITKEDADMKFAERGKAVRRIENRPRPQEHSL